MTACPSGVQYDKLIEQTRPQLERHADRPLWQRAWRRGIFELFTHPGRLRALAPVLALQPAHRLNDALGKLPSPKLQSLLGSPPTSPRARRSASSRSSPRARRGAGRIALMQGCIQRVFFGDVNAATVRVLAAEGFEVHAPRKPRCCGSLMMHAGLEDEALVLARETIAAYEGFDAIGVNVAGCGSGMKDYAHLLSDDPRVERAAAFSAKVKDVSRAAGRRRAARGRHPLRSRSPTTTPPPRPCARASASRARCCARSPARARRARRVADLLRLGRDLQPRPARGGKGPGARAKPAPYRPARIPAAQPGVRPTDRWVHGRRRRQARSTTR